MIFKSSDELHINLDSIISLNENSIQIHDKEKLLEYGIDYLIYSAVLSEDAQTRHLARVYIRKIAPEFNVFPASLFTIYEAMGKGEVSGFTIPAMNVRTLTYDFAREVFKKAIQHDASSFIFEISRTEMKYTKQDQDEVAVCVLAAAIKEGYSGPVFLQGDHYQFNKKKFDEYSQGQIDEIELEVKTAIAAGFYNIDIDASTLVDLSKPSKDEQQIDNYQMTSVLTKFVRKMQPSGLTITIGGEIGHIGDVNSDVEDFEAFMNGYLENLKPDNLKIISKVAVQTGTSHGGVVNPDGTLKVMDVDFEVLNSIGKAAKEKYQIAGTVQHGASTLPLELFDKFPQNNTAEIHLATGFQNIIYDNIPSDLREKLYEYIRNNLNAEREEGMEEAQFIYKARKKAFGPHKKDFWLLSENDKKNIRDKLAEYLELAFIKLNIVGTSHTVRNYIGEGSSVIDQIYVNVEHDDSGIDDSNLNEE